MVFLAAKERAYFFFGDDIQSYLESLWQDIVTIRSVDEAIRQSSTMPKQFEDRHKAINRVADFYKVGRPLFAKYMRFSQKVPAFSRA